MEKWRLRIFAAITEDLIFKTKDAAIDCMRQVLNARVINAKQKEEKKEYRDIQTFSDDFESLLCFDITTVRCYKIDKLDTVIDEIRDAQLKNYTMENQILKDKLDEDGSWRGRSND